MHGGVERRTGRAYRWKTAVSETESETETEPQTETGTPDQSITGDPANVVEFSGGEQVGIGETTSLTATVDNVFLFPITNVELSLTAPDGWSVETSDPTEFDEIESGGSEEVTWNITAPSDAGMETTITGSISYESETDSAEADVSRTIAVFEPGVIPEEGLEAYYSLDGETATNDVTGTDATQNGSPTSGAEGVVGDAFSFDANVGGSAEASNDGLQSGEDLPLNDGAGTVGAWVNVSGHDDYGRLYQVGGAFDDVPESGWQTRFNIAADEILIETRAGENVSEIALTPALEPDTWYFVVTVVQEGEGRIHVFDQEGELSESPWIGAPTTWDTSESDPLILMTGGFNEGTTGRMDEVRAYSRALSEAEVSESLYPATLESQGSGGSG